MVNLLLKVTYGDIFFVYLKPKKAIKVPYLSAQSRYQHPENLIECTAQKAPNQKCVPPSKVYTLSIIVP